MIGPRCSVAVCVLTMGLAGAGRATAEPACPRGVVLDGDPELAAEVEGRLEALGIAATVLGCAALHVSLGRDAGRVTVALALPDGRRAERTISNTRIAAAWIETWLRPELDAPLLIGHPPVARRGSPAVRRGAARAPRDHWDVGLVGEQLYTSASTWNAVGATTCLTLGGLCVGAAARYATTTDTGTVVLESNGSRTELHGGVHAAWRWRQPYFVAGPSLTVGLAWQRASQLVPPANPKMGSCPLTSCAPEQITYHLGVLLDVGGSAELVLTPRVRLAVNAGAGLAPAQFLRFGVGLAMEVP
jgi:hypothetical protein